MNEGMMNRRKFFQYTAAIGIGGQALLNSRNVKAAMAEAKDSIDATPWPKMSYRKLGRTNYNASRLVFGCGAALSRKPNDKLLETAFAAGVNVFDVGFRSYYRDAEANLSSFANKHRDEIFLISKAYVPIEVEPNEEITPTQAKEGASAWLKCHRWADLTRRPAISAAQRSIRAVAIHPELQQTPDFGAYRLSAIPVVLRHTSRNQPFDHRETPFA